MATWSEILAVNSFIVCDLKEVRESMRSWEKNPFISYEYESLWPPWFGANPNSLMFKRYVSLQNPGHLLQDRYQQVLCQLRFDSDYRQQYSFGSGGSTQRKRKEKSGRAS